MVFRLEDTAGERSLFGVTTVIAVLALVLFAKIGRASWKSLKILFIVTVKLILGLGAIVLTITLVIAVAAMAIA